jgi:uncharacterized phage infection (PIP) family protein YhgE
VKVKGLRRIFGFLLVLFSITGIILSLAGLFLVIRDGGAFVEKGMRVVNLSSLALETTEQSLSVLDTMLDQFVSILDVLVDSSGEITRTMEDTDPLLDSVSTIIGEDIPAVIDATQQALGTLEQSAGTVDKVLYALSKISFLTGVNYDPEVPLAESVVVISNSLNALSPSLDAMDDDLSTARENLSELEEEVRSLDGSLQEIQSGVEEAQSALDEYQRIVSQTREEVDVLQENAPRWLRIGVGVAIFSLVWALLLQVHMLFESWKYINGNQEI